MATVPVPTDWPSGVPARPGLPPRNTLARILDAQTVFTQASRRYSLYVPLGRGYDDQMTETEAPDTDPEEIRIRVPPWTTHLIWGVLSEGDDADAEITVQRDGETYYHTIPCPGPGGDYLPGAALYLSDGIPDGDDQPQHIHAGTASASWQTITLQVWVTDAAVYGIMVECLRMSTISD